MLPFTHQSEAEETLQLPGNDLYTLLQNLDEFRDDDVIPNAKQLRQTILNANARQEWAGDTSNVHCLGPLHTLRFHPLQTMLRANGAAAVIAHVCDERKAVRLAYVASEQDLWATETLLRRSGYQVATDDLIFTVAN